MINVARMAQCRSCSKVIEVSGTKEPPFYEYMGEGSYEATKVCVHCERHVDAHQTINPMTGWPGITNHNFVPIGPQECDFYYCGCRGWD